MLRGLVLKRRVRRRFSVGPEDSMRWMQCQGISSSKDGLLSYVVMPVSISVDSSISRFDSSCGRLVSSAFASRKIDGEGYKSVWRVIYSGTA